MFSFCNFYFVIFWLCEPDYGLILPFFRQLVTIDFLVI